MISGLPRLWALRATHSPRGTRMCWPHDSRQRGAPKMSRPHCNSESQKPSFNDLEIVISKNS